MKFLLSALIALLLQTGLLGADDGAASKWEELARSSPGVYVVKLNADGSIRYVFFSAGDRVRSISSLLQEDVYFLSFDESVRFAKMKPQRVILMETAHSEEVVDDKGWNVLLTDDERSALGVHRWGRPRCAGPEK